jgi:DNA polymerase
MGSVKQDLLTMIRQVENAVFELQSTGEEVSLFYTAPEPVPTVQAVPQKTPAPIPVRPQVAKPLSIEKTAAVTGDFSPLAQEVDACTACPLHRDRMQTVLGEGSREAAVVFIGEAPGAEEEREGRPFRGQAGELLDKILASIGLDRKQVYLCNLLKCRLPGNRNPTTEEMAACRGHLEKQLALLHPRLICTLGAFAAQALLQTQEPLSQLRGREHTFRGIPVIPTLHPEALIFHPQNKRQVWEDMKLVAAKLGLKPQGRS